MHKSRFCTGSPGPENEGADAGTDGLHVGFTWIRDVVLASPSVPLHVPPVQLHYPHLLFLDTNRHVLTGHNIETGQLDMEVAWDHLLAPTSPTWYVVLIPSPPISPPIVCSILHTKTGLSSTNQALTRTQGPQRRMFPPHEHVPVRASWTAPVYHAGAP